MDPNETLRNMYQLAVDIQALDDAGNPTGYEAFELAQAVLDLNAWLSTGGALPEGWVGREKG